ncbi:hypothetical protein RS130_22250 [Paraglaciecola aquimarina]|uniref:DUF3718 domain-containing protein n=1 Tax=Paraglaciecola aquimarina TaxID=1235557 RepID=A0ABU3T209_9ALTE|nr:hypothetical protein [Paraglaciecola aquimarina]MDU0356243.1 hypothetical protein [Paraglaciecola aquimarina]
MKTILLSAVVVFTASMSLTANAGMKFVGETKYASLCEAAATNNTQMLKQSVRQHASEFGFSNKQMLRVIAEENNFQCSGKGLVEFSEMKGSVDVANYLTSTDSQSTPEVQQASSKYKFVGDSEFASFCKSAINNDLGQFKRALSRQVGNIASSRQKVLDIALEGNNISCGGVSLTEFFEQNNATNVLEYITQ